MTDIKVTANPCHTHTLPLTCKVDTGAEVKVISKEDYDRLIPSPQHRHLGPAQYRITAYGGHTTKTLGTCLWGICTNKIQLQFRNIQARQGDLPWSTCALQTTTEDKLKHAADYFWGVVLIIVLNTVSSVWYNFSIETKGVHGETKS